MVSKYKYLVGAFALTIALVGCGKKDEAPIQQGADTAANEATASHDPSADLQAAKEEYVSSEPAPQNEGYDFEANKQTSDQPEPKSEDSRDFTSMLNDAAESAEKQTKQQ